MYNFFVKHNALNELGIFYRSSCLLFDLYAISSSALDNRDPARTTVEVVPSPTSLSVALLISTIILAAGCCISISLRIVAPSFVIVTSPMLFTSILSIPLGPRLVRTISAIVFAAVMLFLCAWLPFVSELPYLKRTIGIGCCCCCIDIDHISPLGLYLKIMF